MDTSNTDAIARATAGCVWGTAIGDAWGLPCEGLTPRRLCALFGGVPTGYQLLGQHGMVSDDTEHTFLVWDALTTSAGNGDAFTRALARGLRRWTLALPAGVGWATLRAGLRLCVGIPPARSGVYSAGNGPAMRAALVGVVCAWDRTPDRLRDLVARSARLTHTDPRAEWGALAVAVCAAHFARHDTRPDSVLSAVCAALPPDAGELRDLIAQVAASLDRGETTEAFAATRYPHGVSGYVYQTVPVALHAALRFPGNLPCAVQGVVACGGDTDTTAAIAGGIVGANISIDGIAPALLRGIWEPTGLLAGITERADAFSSVWCAGQEQAVRPVPLPAALARNAVFAGIVLSHGFRRLLPPW